MVQDLLDQAKEFYNSYGRGTLPDWDTAEIIVTIKNYEIGTYKNGVFTLKGER